MCVMCYVMLGTGEGREEGSPDTQTIRNNNNNNNTTNTGTVTITITTLKSHGNSRLCTIYLHLINLRYQL